MFKFKKIIIGKTSAADNTKDVDIALPLKYLSNFLRAPEMPLINWKTSLQLTFSANLVITNQLSEHRNNCNSRSKTLSSKSNFVDSAIICKVHLEFTRFHRKSWFESVTLLYVYFQQDNYKIEFLVRRLGTRI